MKTILIYAIKFYQKTLSPDHGLLKYKHPYGYCRYYPSCSQYGIEAIQEHGSVKGLMFTVKRVLKCNPWSSPAVDKVPKQ